jgi:large subunit ribosomal protein L21
MRPGGGTAINAVIRTGGKQYHVREGSIIRVATLPDEPGSRVELRDVLLLSGDGDVKVGKPLVENAVVVAEVVEHGKGRKVISFKYKAKTRYRRKRGHRQPYTELAVREILADGSAAKEAKATTRRRASRRAEEAPEETSTEASAKVAEARATSEEKPAPTRRRRRTTAADKAEE